MNISSDEKGKTTFRRLLLSKELYLHGSSTLDKMIAIHNFHNSLEIVLRSILLQHEIRAEKELNIDFESMLNAIDSHFKEKKIKLPYRQEIWCLNQLRNIVQHHASEPETSAMYEWRVFTGIFLTKTFHTYFNIQFNEVTSTHFIENTDLRNLLLIAYEFHKQEKYFEVMIAAKLTFMYMSYHLRAFLPANRFNSDFFVIANLSSELRDMREAGLEKLPKKIEETITKIYSKIDESKLYSIIISAGISFTDYKQYEKITPSIDFTLTGSYIVQTVPNYKDNLELASWILNFVEQTVIKLQLIGIELNLNEQLVNLCHDAIANFNSELNKLKM